MLDLASNLWVLRFINYVFKFYEYCIIGYILLSWFPKFRDNIISDFLITLCEPYLKVFRKIIPPVGILDISPIIAILSLEIVYKIVIYIVFGISPF